jgi:hypothetical protein
MHTRLQTLRKCHPEIIHGVCTWKIPYFINQYQSPNIYSAYQYTKNHQLTFKCSQKNTMDGLKKGDNHRGTAVRGTSSRMQTSSIFRSNT